MLVVRGFTFGGDCWGVLGFWSCLSFYVYCFRFWYFVSLYSTLCILNFWLSRSFRLRVYTNFFLLLFHFFLFINFIFFNFSITSYFIYLFTFISVIKASDFLDNILSCLNLDSCFSNLGVDTCSKDETMKLHFLPICIFWFRVVISYNLC